MRIFFAVIAALTLFLMMVQKENKDRRTYSFCFMTTMAVLGAMEIIPLFLA